jgi:hypothetical protein
MFGKNKHEASAQPKPGYPVRVLGKLAVHPREVIVPGQVPTADQIVEAACEAVRFTQKTNKYPGVIIAGERITAAPTSGKNGSVFFAISGVGKTQSRDIMSVLLPDDKEMLDRVEGVGVYVTSSKKWALAPDIDAVGVVLCDINAERLSDTLFDRRQLEELSDAQKQQLGILVALVENEADLAYGEKLQKLAK